MAAEGLQEEFDAGLKLQDSSPTEAITKLRSLVLGTSPNDAESIKVKEAAIGKLADLYASQRDAQALRTLLTELRPLFSLIPKAKTAKIVRTTIETMSKVPNSTQLQVEVCKEQAEWARGEKRTFLRQRIDARLANLYLDTKDYQAALGLISKLLTEVKRLDDKLLLVDIHLLESRVHDSLRNIPKAKAALTAARTAANAIYIPPSLQAEIDTQSGKLHAEEKDYKTAYSYFFEAFEAQSSLDQPGAVLTLKYMLMAKIMMGDADDVPSIIASKAGLKYAGVEVDAMRAVAKAHKERSLQAFQEALDSHQAELIDDPAVHSHLSVLYGNLMEQNLARLIEPYSRVEVAHIAELIKLPADVVEARLSKMILDKKFAGTLDQGAGCLEVFEEPAADTVYASALSSIENMGDVIDTLFQRSQKIAAA